MKRTITVAAAAWLIMAGWWAVPAWAQPAFWTELPPGTAAPIVNIPSLAPLADRTMPAVVTVYTKKEGVGYFFFTPVPRMEEGAGSGFVISSDGYILTNNHVVAGSDQITVEVGLKSKRKYQASLVGADKDADVALIKIDAQGLPVLPLGDSDRIKVGDWVVAIGSPFGLSHTFTTGVVSAKGRRRVTSPFDDFIQTDASINSGNSGGPLISLAGEVIGINTMILSPSGGNVGIGLSVPINIVKMLLPQIMESGKVTRSWLGVSVDQVSDEMAREAGLDRARGAHVAQVVIDSPADKAGIEVDDILLSFDGREISDATELPLLVSSFGVGRNVKMELVRGSERLVRAVQLEERPPPDRLSKLEVRGGDPMASADNVLGVAVKEISDQERQQLNLGAQHGVLVTAVADNSPGSAAGIEPGDIIYSINGRNITVVKEYNDAVSRLRSGSYVRVNIRRGNTNLFRVFRL